MKITLENGITLETNEQTEQLQKYALEKNISNARCFKTSNNTFLLFIGTKPEFESEKYEDVAVHIDIMAISKNI